MRSLLLLTLIFFMPILSVIAETTATTSVLPEKAHIGDKLLLTVTVSYSHNELFSNPKIEVSPLSNREDNNSTWTLLATPVVNKSDDGKIIEQKHQYAISAFMIGKLDLPDIRLTYNVNDTETTTVLLPKQNILIASSLPSDDAISMKPLKSPFVIPFPKWIYLAIGAIGLLILIAVIMLIIVLAKRRIIPIIAPPLTLEQWANKELDKLGTEKLVESRQYKVYFSRLSETLRLYTAKLYGVPALDLTTDELLNRLQAMQIQGQYIDSLSSSLNNADLVKFAKFEPDFAFCNKTMSHARNYISETSMLSSEEQPVSSSARD